MIIKIFISISSNTTQALAAHFDFTSFLSRPFFFFLVLGRSFFYTQGVLVEIFITSTKKKVHSPAASEMLQLLMCYEGKSRKVKGRELEGPG